MQTFRISYQNHEDKVIRNRHARVKAKTAEEAKAILLSKAQHLAIYKIEAV